jgi:hypothetical protein
MPNKQVVEGQPAPITINFNITSPDFADAEVCSIRYRDPSRPKGNIPDQAAADRDAAERQIDEQRGLRIKKGEDSWWQVTTSWTPEIGPPDAPLKRIVECAVFMRNAQTNVEERVTPGWVEIDLWAKTVEVQTVDEAGQPVNGAEFMIEGHPGRYATENGRCEHPTLSAPVDLRFCPPAMLQRWEEGRDPSSRVRKAVLSMEGEYKAKIYGPPELTVEQKRNPRRVRRVGDKDHLKCYVNLGNSPDPALAFLGRELQVIVGSDRDAQTRQGDRIYIQAIYSNTSKRTLNMTRGMPAVAGEPDLLPDERLQWSHHFEIQADGDRATFLIDLGRSGGQTWEIKVGRTSACDDETLWVETWRRVYYQITSPPHLRMPAPLQLFADCMKEIFVDVARIADVEVTRDSRPELQWLTYEDIEKIGWQHGDENLPHPASPGEAVLLCCSAKPQRATLEGLLVPGGEIEREDKLYSGEETIPNLVAHYLICDDIRGTEPQSWDSKLSFGKTDEGEHYTLSPRKEGDEPHEREIISVATRPMNPMWPRGLSFSWSSGSNGGPLDAARVTLEDGRAVIKLSDAPALAAILEGPYMHPKKTGVVHRWSKSEIELHITGTMISTRDCKGLTFGNRTRHMLIGIFGAIGSGGDLGGERVAALMVHELGHALRGLIGPTYEAANVAAARAAHDHHSDSIRGCHCTRGKCVMQADAPKRRFCADCKKWFQADAVGDFVTQTKLKKSK